MLIKPLLRKVRAVFFDIDDTFSSDGKIRSEAFQALWKLHESGIFTVPVTGRPAGWCDHIARMWPVSAIIGENGAFFLFMNKNKLKKVYLESARIRSQNAVRLKKLQVEVLRAFPGAKFPSDQPFREFDFAIDFCEDVKPWSNQKIQKLVEFCRIRGASAKISSIHVNVWYGRYDKWTCAKHVMKLLKIKSLNEICYLGDSPNDEPFFEHLPFTVGVRNVERFLKQMQYKPKFITKSPGGLGFAEFVHKLIQDRAPR